MPQSMLDAVLPALNETVRDLVNIQLLTGMRSSELCAFKAQHVDTTGAIWKYTVPDTINKTEHHGTTRVVFIGADAQKLLRRYLFGVNYKQASYRCDHADLRQSFSDRSYRRRVGEVAERSSVPPTPDSTQLRHNGTREIRAGTRAGMSRPCDRIRHANLRAPR